ncbi:LysR substrate-binding domain-containing protein [Xanthomonas campestris]|uniref:LysR substrate-binding domain-containing protein n=1 Tax=Xanthomonas campestris TaxID=339 RepID=UPI002368A319|nr:LysR substrate-binding domain-containing protein [Xanthomonas campestris]
MPPAQILDGDAAFGFAQKADDLLVSKTFLHVQSPRGRELDSKLRRYSKLGGRRLGTMRYHAIASPDVVARYFSSGLDAAGLSRAPMMVFNRKDTLQARFARRITRMQLSPPIHYLPTSTGFVDAAARGLGWCLAPEAMVLPAVERKTLLIIDPTRWLDVPLYWQHAAVRSTTLQRLGDSLRTAAAASLRVGKQGPAH